MIRSARLVRLSRRRVLKGLLNGTAVTVGLPLLDCMLTDSGQVRPDASGSSRGFSNSMTSRSAAATASSEAVFKRRMPR